MLTKIKMLMELSKSQIYCLTSERGQCGRTCQLKPGHNLASNVSSYMRACGLDSQYCCGLAMCHGVCVGLDVTIGRSRDTVMTTAWFCDKERESCVYFFFIIVL